MSQPDIRQNHRAVLALLHVVPGATFLLGTWLVFQLDLMRLTPSMVDSFEILYDAFSGAFFWTILIPLLLSALLFVVYDVRRHRRLERKLRGSSVYNRDSDPLFVDRIRQMPPLRRQRWNLLVWTQLKRSLLLCSLGACVLVLLVLFLRYMSGTDRITQAGLFGYLIVLGPLSLGGVVAIVAWLFNKRARWRTLFHGLSRAVVKSKDRFAGEFLHNIGFLQWMDRYWCDEWRQGFAWHGIGVAMFIQGFAVYLYADQRSERRLNILVAATLPDSSADAPLAKLIADLADDRFAFAESPAGFVVTASRDKVSSLLFKSERYGEEAGEVLLQVVTRLLQEVKAKGAIATPELC